MNEKLLQIIIDVADELNGDLDATIPVDRREEAPLYGPQGVLTSLGLVSLVVGVEQAIAQEFGISVTLADEKAVSHTRSPFRTIGTLAEYADGLIQKAN